MIFQDLPLLQMLIGTMLPPNYNTGYTLEYYAEPEYFDKYLLQVQKIIDSFQLIKIGTNEVVRS